MPKAFTLLELLVVITIIGILASIVVVSMSGSTDSDTIAKGKTFSQQIHALLGHETVLDLNFNENTYDSCPDEKDVCDASGYNNNGTIYGATYTSSPVDGYALSFNGTSDYIDCGGVVHDASNEQITVETWISTNNLDVMQIIVGERGNPSFTTGYAFSFQGTAVGDPFRFTMFGVVDKNSAASGISVGIWMHVAVTYDKQDIIFYKNGNRLSSHSQTGEISPATRNLFVGALNNYGTPSGYFSGLIDDVRIYSEALPSTEIQKHYVQGLENLLVNQAITQAEYDQRMEEFNQYLSSNRF